MIHETAVIDGQTWRIEGDDRPNPLSPTPRITATVDGVTVDLHCQHRQITAVRHTDGCTWGVNLSPVCTCAPQPTDHDALFTRAREVLLRCMQARDAAEAAADRARLERPAGGNVYIRVPAGCDPCPSTMAGGPCTCC